MLKRFFAVLSAFAIVLSMGTIAFAADTSIDTTNDFVYSIFPVDDVVVQRIVSSTRYNVLVPYPGAVRQYPEVGGTTAPFYSSYMSNQNPIGAVSRFSYYYSPWEYVDPSIPSWSTRYQLIPSTPTDSATTLPNVCEYIQFETDGVVIPLITMRSNYLPSLEFSWPGSVPAGTSLDCYLYYKVYWYELVDGVYTIRTAEVEEEWPILEDDLIAGDGSFTVSLVEYLPDQLSALDANTLLSVTDYQFRVSFYDVSSGFDIYTYYRDYYTDTPFHVSDFAPPSGAEVEPPNFWDWIISPLSGLFDTPFIYGWSLGQIYSVVFAVIIVIILLKFFAGG